MKVVLGKATKGKAENCRDSKKQNMEKGMDPKKGKIGIPNDRGPKKGKQGRDSKSQKGKERDGPCLAHFTLLPPMNMGIPKGKIGKNTHIMCIYTSCVCNITSNLPENTFRLRMPKILLSRVFNKDLRERYLL